MKKAKKHPERKSDSVALELRRLGVVVEHVDDKVSLVAEQYGGIKKDIGEVKETLKAHGEVIAELSVNIEIVKTDVEFIKNSLKKKVDVDEFAALERRVSLLEKRR